MTKRTPSALLAAALAATLGLCAAAHAETYTRNCAYDRYRGRWICNEHTYYSPEEARRLHEQVARHHRENPEGCNREQDGLQFCWRYDTIGDKVHFGHVFPGEKCSTSPLLCSQHGLQYTYNINNGRLYEIQIYDRSIVPKGENSYRFKEDGSVTVFDHKRNNTPDQFSNIYSIPVDEALRRLNLPRSILHQRFAPNPQQLSAKQGSFPAGCSGTAPMRIGRTACNVELLWKQ